MEAKTKFTVAFTACVEGDVEQEIGFDHNDTYKAHRTDIEMCVEKTIEFIAANWHSKADLLAVCNGYQGRPTRVGIVAAKCVEETLVGFFTEMAISSEIDFARARLLGNAPEKAGFLAVERIDEYGHFHIQIFRCCGNQFGPRQSVSFLPLTSCYAEVLGVALRSEFGRMEDAADDKS